MYNLYPQMDGLANVFGFTYKGNSRFKTSCGATLTILLFLVGSAISLTFLLKLVDRSNPNIEVTFKKSIDPPKMDINTTFAVYIKRNEALIEPDPLILKAFNNTVHDSNLYDRERQEIPLIPCQRAMFPDSGDKFTQYALENALCLDKSVFSLTGGFPSKDFNFLTFELSLDPNLDADTQKSVQQALDSSDTRLHVFFLDHSFAYEDLEDPVRTYVNHYDIRLIYENQFEADLFFQPGHFSSNNSYTPFSRAVEHFYQASLERVEHKTNFRDAALNSRLCTLTVAASSTAYEINRSFVTLEATLANIVGMMNAANVVVKLFYFMYSKTQFYFDLMGNFSLIHKIEGEAQFSSMLRSNKRVRFKKPTLQSTLNHSYAKNSTDTGVDLTKAKFKKIRFEDSFWNILSLSLFKHFYCCTRKFKEKVEYYSQSLLFFEKSIGFEGFVENMRQFDLLKKFLLTSNERNILEKAASIVFLDEFRSNSTIREEHEKRRNRPFRVDINFLKNQFNKFNRKELSTTFEANFVSYLKKFLRDQ